MQRPHPNWSEQDPSEWIAAVRQAVGALARDHDLRKVDGIGLSGQMHGAVTLDAGGNVLRAMRRAEAVADQMKNEPPVLARLEPAK